MNSRTERFQLIESIFHAACAVAGEAREAVIAARCGGDAGLAAEVRRLLAASEKEERQSAQQPSEEAEEQVVGRRIGPYLLDGLLGRGGMGAVYRAHRADGEFEQQVAIKLIDLPLATGLFRDRFRQERQILASLQHPFIARLLNGGVTEEGDPYLVMELVDGIPIHRYCEREKLPLRQRLALFLKVCEAVQFAHQNFVVHRDLKPDNILIAADGAPRLLDFGTAKLLTPSIAAAGSGLTREGYQSFTPQYASPEQVLGQPVTAASDTYSLGILLYLLLTGSLPYELAELTTAELLRAVCHEPPRKPVAAQALGWRLDADLDAILRKALRKEPNARYGTAAELAAEVRAWLEGMPVAARRGDLRYRACKFMRRNRVAVAASGLLAASLFAGVIGVVWQAKAANEERRKAQASAADLRQLSNSLLSELDDAIKELPGTTGVQKLLVTRVIEHLDRAAKNAHGDRVTQLDLAGAYRQLAAIQDDPYEQNLGDPAGALASVDKAIALSEPLAQANPRDFHALRERTLARELRSTILWGTGRTTEAVAAMQPVLSTVDSVVADPHASAALLSAASAAYNIYGDELGQAGPASLNDLPGALAAYRRSLELTTRALSLEPKSLDGRGALVLAQMKVGDVELETDPAQALLDYQSALQRAEALAQEEHGSLRYQRGRSSLLEREAIALAELGEYSGAFQLHDEQIRAEKGLVAADPLDLRAMADLEEELNDEAMAYEAAADPATAAPGSSRRHNLEAAEKLLIQIAAIMDHAMKVAPSNEAWKAIQADAQVRLATVQFNLHGTGASWELAKSGVATLKSLASKDQASPTVLEQAAYDLLKVEPASFKDPQFALTCAERAAALTHQKTPSILLTLARAYRATGQIDKSRAAAAEGLALLAPLHPGAAKPRLRKLLEIQAQPAQ